jgi:HEAT repeat protein
MSDIDDEIDNLYRNRWRASTAIGGLMRMREAAIEPLLEVALGKHTFPDLKPKMGLISALIFSIRVALYAEGIEVQARCNAIFGLEQMKSKQAVQPLIKVMREDSSIEVRRACVHCLGQLDDPAAIEPIAAILDDPAAHDLHFTAAYSLMELGDSRCVPFFIDFLQTSDAIASKPLIVQRISKLRDPRLFDTLVYLLHIPGYQWNVSAEAAMALVKLDDPRAIDPLIEVLNDPKTHGSTEEACLDGLAHFGGKHAAKGILRWLRKTMQIPAQQWLDIEENYGESDWGTPLHVLHFLWINGINSLEKTGDKETIAEFYALLDFAPGYIPRK